MSQPDLTAEFLELHRKNKQEGLSPAEEERWQALKKLLQHSTAGGEGAQPRESSGWSAKDRGRR
jgi:hypothetical protein